MASPDTTPEKTAPPRHIVQARVLEKREVAPRHFRLRLEAPELGASCVPGQFVHVLPRTFASDNEPLFDNFFDPLLRRAFSIMTPHATGIDILFRVMGRGTAILSHVQAGEYLDIVGPLGRGFDLGVFHVKHSADAKANTAIVSRETSDVGQNAVLVGGGIGVPPMVFLSQRLEAMGVPTTVIIGARTSSDVVGVEDFVALGIPPHIVTDDGSRGAKGIVTDLLSPALKDNPGAVVFTCGPLPMLRSVAAVCAASNHACQVSLEENMPCGVGVCNGCVVPVKQADATTEENKASAPGFERYRRICVEGPVCEASSIDWGALR